MAAVGGETAAINSLGARTGRRVRVVAAATLLAVTAVAALAPPANAGRGGKKGQNETTTTSAAPTSTTTSTTSTSTTTTLAPDSSEFKQWEDASPLGSYAHGDYEGSMYWITKKSTNASEYWKAGITGAGVDVALIDTGVAPVDGLTYPGKVINGPDLSFESQIPGMEHLDANGHGTHLAGIIAGRANGAKRIAKGDDANFLGMAPGARIVNVKVGDAYGAVDVSQVIAAIDWVVAHRNDNGMNIRVITLAYGTDGVQPAQIDPLAHAVEMAWRAGIVVVVAAGNDGNSAPLRNPAYDPFVIAVGASENVGHRDASADDVVAEFSNCGTAARSVDLVAPGKSIVSLRVPGSVADTQHPTARVADGFFLGSGTSQAAAVVSGAAALVLEQHPWLTPDQVKRFLATGTAESLNSASSTCQGAGGLDLGAALGTTPPNLVESMQVHQLSDGSGSIDASRGSFKLYDIVSGEKVVLEGEIDIMGNEWTGYDCSTVWTCSSLWSGGYFNGASWSGASWSGASWSGASWSGASWSGASWSGASWSSKSWSGASWSGASWSGASWSGASWSGASWSGASWSSAMENSSLGESS